MTTTEITAEIKRLASLPTQFGQVIDSDTLKEYRKVAETARGIDHLRRAVEQLLDRTSFPTIKDFRDALTRTAEARPAKWHQVPCDSGFIPVKFCYAFHNRAEWTSGVIPCPVCNPNSTPATVAKFEAYVRAKQLCEEKQEALLPLEEVV